MAVAEELVAVLKVDNSNLLRGLSNAQRALDKVRRDIAGGAGRALPELRKVDKAVAANAGVFEKLGGAVSNARSSFLSLKNMVAGFAAVGAFSFFTNLADGIVKVGNVARFSGQSGAAVKALGNVFEQLGFSADSANQTILSLTDSIAKARYGGGISGLLLPMQAFGVSPVGRDGKQREVADMLIEFGDKVKATSSSVEEATMKMRAMGFDQASVAFALAENNRELLARSKALAAGYDEQEETARKMRGSLKQLEQLFTALAVDVLPVVVPLFGTLADALRVLVNPLRALMNLDKPDVVNESVRGIRGALGRLFNVDGFNGREAGASQNVPADGGAVDSTTAGRQGHLKTLEGKYGLPSGVLDAIWDNETRRGKVKNMVSRAGAKGHFQFMDGTAKQYGVDVGSFESSADGAARYMRDLLKRYKGNVKLALAAYNWGPGNVDRWMRRGGSMPSETREYVARAGRVMSQGGGMPMDGGGTSALAVNTTNTNTNTNTNTTNNISVTVANANEANAALRGFTSGRAVNNRVSSGVAA